MCFLSYAHCIVDSYIQSVQKLGVWSWVSVLCCLLFASSFHCKEDSYIQSMQSLGIWSWLSILYCVFSQSSLHCMADSYIQSLWKLGVWSWFSVLFCVFLCHLYIARNILTSSQCDHYVCGVGWVFSAVCLLRHLFPHGPFLHPIIFTIAGVLCILESHYFMSAINVLCSASYCTDNT